MIPTLQTLVLEMIAKGRNLDETINTLCAEVERLVPGVLCSVLTVDEAGLLHPLASPSLPKAYSAAIDNVRIGPSVGSCGTAAYRALPVTVTDIETDPLWAEFKELALPIGLAACWSSPIFDSKNRVVGTFALYYREKRGPGALERQFVDASVHLCSIAMERHAWLAAQQHLAFSDGLTGLFNRARFDGMLAQLSANPPPSGALVLLDIDNLKVVNDSFGHQAGDALIQVVAARIAAHAPSGMTFRLGGDEFAILLTRGEDPDAIAAAVLDALALPADCAGQAIQPEVSAGASMIDAHNSSFDDLRREADLALYDAKEAHRGKYVRYVSGLGTAITRRSNAIRDLGLALRSGRIDAYYQPIVRLDTGEIIGVEALCRMRTTSGEIVAASQFHEALSAGQLAAEVTSRMLSIVASDVRRWLDMNIPFQHVGINVTSADFRGGRLLQRLSEVFGAVSVPLKHVILEVTESVYLGQRDHVIAREIGLLREQGILVALDDFGTGFASLTHLLSIPVDVIKIDKSFIDRLSPADGSTAIVSGVLGIAGKLGIRVVAEGIETSEQSSRLAALGCRLGQGYYFSKAVDRHAMTGMLLRSGQPSASAPRVRPTLTLVSG